MQYFTNRPITRTVVVSSQDYIATGSHVTLGVEGHFQQFYALFYKIIKFV